MEDAGCGKRAGDLAGIVARIERGLAQLNQRRRTGEIGEIAEPDDRASRVARHAADAVERLRRILHLSVRKRLGKTGIRRRALDPRLEARDLALERRAIDDEVAQDRKIAQRLDGHVRLDRLPAGQHLAAVHAHRAGAAHLRAAEPAIGQIGRLVLRYPVERVEHAHPFLVRNPELLELAARTLARTGAPARSIHVAVRKPRIARRKRVMPFDLAEPARASRAGPRRHHGMAHHATSRLSLRTKSGLKNGSS